MGKRERKRPLRKTRCRWDVTVIIRFKSQGIGLFWLFIGTSGGM